MFVVHRGTQDDEVLTAIRKGCQLVLFENWSPSAELFSKMLATGLWIDIVLNDHVFTIPPGTWDGSRISWDFPANTRFTIAPSR